MKLKAIYRFQMKEFKKNLILFYFITILLFSVLLVSCSSIMTPRISHTDDTGKVITQEVETSSLGSQSFSGLDLINVIALGFFGYYTFRSFFSFFIQNGRSRKSILAGQTLASLTLVFAMAVLNTIILFICKQWSSYLTATYRPTDFLSFYEMVYKTSIQQTGTLSFYIINLLFNLSLFLFIITDGYLISLIYYRINRIAKLILNICFFSYFFVFHNVINSMTDGRLNSQLGKLASIFFGKPLLAITNFMLLSLIIVYISWLLIKKAPIRELA